jgi:hypothetical protein
MKLLSTCFVRIILHEFSLMRYDAMKRNMSYRPVVITPSELSRLTEMLMN